MVMMAAARQAKPANSERRWLAADIRLSARSTALFMTLLILLIFIQTVRHVGVNEML